MLTDSIYIIFTAFDFIALALIFTLVITGVWLAPATSSAERVPRRQLLLLSLIVTALCGSLDLLFRTATLADVSPWDAFDFIPKVVNQSDYGSYWLVRAIMWLLMLITFIWIRKGQRGLIPCIVFISGALTTLLMVSTTSHAGENGVWTAINLINWLHLVSISAWGGAVLLYAYIVLPVLIRGSLTQKIASASARLSMLATIALIFVLSTGIFNSWRQIGELSNLWTSDYGEILIVKVALVSVMMLIGAINRFYLVPRVEQWGNHPNKKDKKIVARFQAVLRVDSVLFVTIILAAVILGMQSPPAHL